MSLIGPEGIPSWLSGDSSTFGGAYYAFEPFLASLSLEIGLLKRWCSLDFIDPIVHSIADQHGNLVFRPWLIQPVRLIIKC